MRNCWQPGGQARCSRTWRGWPPRSSRASSLSPNSPLLESEWPNFALSASAAWPIPTDTAWAGNLLVLQRLRAFIAAYRDPELAFLLVAELWQRAQSGFAGDARQRSAAVEEARMVLVPCLEMLGMFALRVNLEGQLLLAEGRTLQLDEAARQAGRAIIDELRPKLPDAQFILNKYAQMHSSMMQNRGGGKLVLLPTITVLVADEDACFQALRWVHTLYTPVDGGIEDSLFAPNHNGYRSLNVWVVASLPNGRARVSFAIHPAAQQEINEWGVAARLMRSRVATPTPDAWWNDAAASCAKIDVAPIGALPEKLCCLQSERGNFHL